MSQHQVRLHGPLQCLLERIGAISRLLDTVTRLLLNASEQRDISTVHLLDRHLPEPSRRYPEVRYRAFDYCSLLR